MEITFKIDNNGVLEMDVSEASGKECEKVTASMIENLGEIKDQNFKPEYYFDGGEENPSLQYQEQ